MHFTFCAMLRVRESSDIMTIHVITVQHLNNSTVIPAKFYFSVQTSSNASKFECAHTFGKRERENE